MSRFVSNFDAVRKALDDALVEGMAAATLRASRVVRTLLSQPGTGRVYRISKGRKTGRNRREKGFHVASAPGRPPAPNTKRLANSWIVQVAGSRISSKSDSIATITQSDRRVVLEFGSRVEYAPMLEYGTSRMKARPYLKPAMPFLIRDCPKDFSTAIKRKFRR